MSLLPDDFKFSDKELTQFRQLDELIKKETAKKRIEHIINELMKTTKTPRDAC